MLECTCPICAKDFGKLREGELRARELFVSLLSTKQKEEMELLGRVTEKSLSGKIYIINLLSLVSNIWVQRHGVRCRLCIYMEGERNGAVPVYDHFIAQLLYVRYNEPELLRIAVCSLD